jgi:TetR/AcrR family transcriptional regulator, fatty acid biosynthesis regulator
MDTEANKRVRRRYSPELRRNLILDFTADIVAREGIAALSMERIAAEAEISKALVYRYFPTLIELLRTLLQRELHELRKRQAKAATPAKTFEELVRAITREYLLYIESRGRLIERLQSEPSISDTKSPTDYGRERAVDYLAKIAARHFGIPPRAARAATDMSFGIPTAAGYFLTRHNYSRQEIEDIAVNMILGGFNQLASDYLLKRRSLKKE